MTFIFRELIKKKRDGDALTEDEIRWMISTYSKGEIPDYQMSAMLMAIYHSSMTKDEAVVLTDAMKNSGKVLDLSSIEKPKIDKHSTGGVGDKTSMILGPMAAAAGLAVPMMAGRGLGHTGGTLDKLEAIPGFNIEQSESRFKEILNEVGICIIGQSSEICPADKKLYALRDVTATVESIPLICASIMSKKLAEGIDGIVLDVKFGSGAFMKSLLEAKTLAQSLCDIGSGSGKKVTAVLSNMNQVLGRYVGNATEMLECIEILNNPKSHPKYFDTVELSIHLCAEMLLMAGVADSLDAGIKKAKQVLEDGSAFAVFEKMVKLQGGDLKGMPQPYEAYDYKAAKSGCIGEINPEKIGIAGIRLRAGREKTSDQIDPRSGFEVLVKIGDQVRAGDVLCKVFAKTPLEAEAAFDMLHDAFRIVADTIKPVDLIGERILSN